MFDWAVNPEFGIGSVVLHWYTLFYGCGLLAAYFAWTWQAGRRGVTSGQSMLFMFLFVLAVFVGCRVAQLAAYEPARWLADPSLLWKPGIGKASHGGVLAVMLLLWGFARYLGKPVLELFDACAVAGLCMVSAVRIGNLFNSEIIGRQSPECCGVRFPLYDHGLGYLSWSASEQALALAETPWRYPTPIYECLMGLVLVMILIVYERRSVATGVLTAIGLIGYFGGRFLIEFFKEYQAYGSETSSLVMGQWLSLPFIIVGCWLSLSIYRKQQRERGING